MRQCDKNKKFSEEFKTFCLQTFSELQFHAVGWTTHIHIIAQLGIPAVDTAPNLLQFSNKISGLCLNAFDIAPSIF